MKKTKTKKQHPRKKKKKKKNWTWAFLSIKQSQWRSQKFRLGGARLKDKIENKKLI